jgi:glycosyltransferase involved in cell wall biosynthesis
LKLISIIIPCYNYGHLVEFTIQSIFEQTYTNWEIIVINDGSTDNTEDIILNFQKIDSRIKYFKIQNSGPSAARNRGIDESKGEYLMFIDSDDLLCKRKFESHVNHFISKPTIDISFSDALYFDHNFPNKFYLRSSFINKRWIPRIKITSGFNILMLLLTKNIVIS